jgi:hypothetical protein
MRELRPEAADPAVQFCSLRRDLSSTPPDTTSFRKRRPATPQALDFGA